MSICGDVNSIVYDLFCCRNEKFQTNENDNCCFHENSLKLVKIKRVIWTRSPERTSKMNISISHNLRKCKNGNGISVLPWTDSSKIAVLGNLNIYHTIQCIELNCIECFPQKMYITKTWTKQTLQTWKRWPILLCLQKIWSDNRLHNPTGALCIDITALI